MINSSEQHQQIATVKEWNSLSTAFAECFEVIHSAVIHGPTNMFAALTAKCHLQPNVDSMLT